MFKYSLFHYLVQQDEIVAGHQFASQDLEIDGRRWVQTFWGGGLFLERFNEVSINADTESVGPSNTYKIVGI